MYYLNAKTSIGTAFDLASFFSEVKGFVSWFISMDGSNADWDIKRKRRWEQQLQGLPWLGQDGDFEVILKE